MINRNPFRRDKGREEWIFQEVKRAVRSAARKFGLSPSDTDDLVGDVLESLYKDPERLRDLVDREKLAAYAYTAAVRRVVKNLRRTAKRNEIPLDSAGAVRPGEAGAVATRIDVRNAVMGLDGPLAAVVLARHFLDMTFPEIAQQFGMPEPTVKSRYRKAQAELAKVIRHPNDDAGR
jgi:RNA polymerase sigma factor (sigma-70 family)